jgi:hypothetical protein
MQLHIMAKKMDSLLKSVIYFSTASSSFSEHNLIYIAPGL